MKTLKIENNDLVFDKSMNLEMVEDEEEIRQSIERTLSTNLSEYFLNVDMGLNYSQIRGKGIKQDDIESAIREAIFQDERIEEVDFTEIITNNKSRSLSVEFNAIANGKNIDGLEVIV